MATILDLIPPDSGDPLYYQDAIVNVLENFIPTLKTSIRTKIVNVQPAQALEYEGSFYGLLSSLGYPPRYHRIILRVNDMTTPWEYSRSRPMAVADMLTFLLPDSREIDAIVQAQNTTAPVGLT